MLITSTIKGNVPFSVLGFVNGPGAAFRVVDDVPEHLDQIVVKRTADGEVLVVPRSDVFTPIEVCPRCYTPMFFKKRPHSVKRIVECPYHAHHQYEALYAASHDLKLNRKQRRWCVTQSQVWLNEWKQTAKMIAERKNADTNAA